MMKDNNCNTVHDNYSSVKVTFLHPIKMQFHENPYIPIDGPLSRQYITTFVCSKFHPTGEIFTYTFKK